MNTHKEIEKAYDDEIAAVKRDHDRNVSELNSKFSEQLHVLAGTTPGGRTHKSFSSANELKRFYDVTMTRYVKDLNARLARLDRDKRISLRNSRDKLYRAAFKDFNAEKIEPPAAFRDVSTQCKRKARCTLF